MLKIVFVFENYATFSLSMLVKKKTYNNSIIMYLLLLKHDIFFILCFTLALIKYNKKPYGFIDGPFIPQETQSKKSEYIESA